MRGPISPTPRGFSKNAPCSFYQVPPDFLGVDCRIVGDVFSSPHFLILRVHFCKIKQSGIILSQMSPRMIPRNGRKSHPKSQPFFYSFRRRLAVQPELYSGITLVNSREASLRGRNGRARDISGLGDINADGYPPLKLAEVKSTPIFKNFPPLG